MVDLWKITLRGRIPNQRLDTFCSYVESQETYSRITLDQWTSFLDFSYECEDLSSYDESASAWPVLIDEYVEHMEEQEQKTKNAKKSKWSLEMGCDTSLELVHDYVDFAVRFPSSPNYKHQTQLSCDLD